MVTKVYNDFGSIDVLVNNAGIATKSTTIDLIESEWDQVIDVNLKGTFLCSQAVIPYMQRQGFGRIINLTSIAGQTGGAIGAYYAASKAGIIGLTRFMARELGPSGITVNAIAPSGIPTDLLSNLGMEPNDQRPVRRVGTPQDIAATVRYLASESAGYVTGQVISVNGGIYFG
jgi:NAD(P)-dependent dehydrogenase (short-subunit alcohol dehydrogenase family)